MGSKYLFPYKSRFVGIGLILLHIPIRAIWEYLYPGLGEHHLPVKPGDSVLFTNQHLFSITSAILMLVGLFLIAFSKEKIEDEQIAQLRLDSLRWSIYLNYLILLLSLIFTNGIDFIDILRLNLWVPLLFFIIRFRWVLFRLNRSLTEEKN
ncbi:MAG: hypothetical protein JST75_01440 [Bacteroidetes bacterium]|nr:hypothetical protein [Bacteroidota bacterium]